MIKVLIPSMPTADELLPFLRTIDATRHYVKGGPLVRLLEGKLSALTGSQCTVVSNGTVSLELALRAMRLPPGALVLVPAVTFVATAQAVANAGLRPLIVDVDAESWQLDAKVARELCQADLRIAAALPVAAFGRAVPIEPWERFIAATGLPVLIDAAGAIYGQRSSDSDNIAVSYSLNATKALGAGEGGVVASNNLRLIERVASMANFGPGGTNARMSEYHAAVALASLGRDTDDWRTFLQIRYARLRPPDVLLGCGAMATLLPALLPPHANAEAVGEAMAAAGIETRAWYRPFLDEQPEFFQAEKIGPMPTTVMLRQRLLGLPFHAFLSEDDVGTVCAALKELLPQP